jgi:ribulose-bisphosphate carboxylase large chain
MSRIIAKYLIETAHPIEKAAEMMAGEQSSGTFVKVAGESKALRERFLAKIISIEEVREVDHPTLPGSKPPKGVKNPVYKRANVTLTWPLENVGVNLPNLVSTVSGNLYELSPFSGLKLIELELPDEFSRKYPGPQFGVTGTLDQIPVATRPIIGTIIKPSVGLTPEATANRVRTLIEAGLDFIKDDELMGDPPHSPFNKRVELVMQVINDYAQKSGKKPMYAFNVSGDMDDMLSRHDKVVEHGGTCIMVNINSVGISGVTKLRRNARLPIHGHRNGWGAMTRCEVLGMDYQPYQVIWRVAGIDHMHVNGLRNKFCEPDRSVISSIKALRTPLFGGYYAMPVISSGQWAGQAVDTYRAIQTTDIMYLCGGGIVGHPMGIEAGVKSVIQGWQAALEGISLHEKAETHYELKTALEFYG